LKSILSGHKGVQEKKKGRAERGPKCQKLVDDTARSRGTPGENKRNEAVP